MASTYSNLLRVELQTSGENDSSWGAKANTSMEMLEAGIAARAAVTHDDTANYTLSTANGSTDEARCMILNIGGTLTAARNTVCPTKSKLYIVKNATTGGYATTLKTTAGTGISVPNGYTMILMCDGTNVVNAIDVVGVTAGLAAQVDQAVTAWTRSATTTLGTTLNGTLSDTSTTITAFNGVAGVTYHCRALGVGAITHHGTNLIITQTGASIAATAAGDTFDVEMLTATTCRVKNYMLASGAALVSGGLTLGTPVAATSGTSIDFTGIPAGTKLIMINFSLVSTNGANIYQIQLGDAGGIENTVYSAASTTLAAAGNTVTTSTTGFPIRFSGDTFIVSGTITLCLENAAAFTWSASGTFCNLTTTTMTVTTAGNKSLSAELTQVRITMDGTDTFDAGEINIAYM